MQFVLPDGLPDDAPFYSCIKRVTADFVQANESSRVDFQRDRQMQPAQKRTRSRASPPDEVTLKPQPFNLSSLGQLNPFGPVRIMFQSSSLSIRCLQGLSDFPNAIFCLLAFPLDSSMLLLTYTPPFSQATASFSGSRLFSPFVLVVFMLQGLRLPLCICAPLFHDFQGYFCRLPVP